MNLNALPCVAFAAVLFACSNSNDTSAADAATAPGNVSVEAGAATPADAGASDSATPALTDASSAQGKACLDDGSNGPGVPFTCDVLPAGLSEQEITTVCGAFKVVANCPADKRTYRCGNAKSFVLPSARTERLYYLSKVPASEKAVRADCTGRDGSYSEL